MMSRTRPCGGSSGLIRRNEKVPQKDYTRICDVGGSKTIQ
jgi:hypothetical protein